MTQKDKVKELVGRGLHSYHTKALQQMDRIEKKNKEQNHKISILSNELDNDYLTKTEEGSVISLEHSKEGMIYLDELQGNTLVNYCTDGSKEMTLNGDIDVEGTFVTTTEGVDNGKVDVMCEGNTLVNLFNYNNLSHNVNTHVNRIITLPHGGVCDCIFPTKTNVIYTVMLDITDLPTDTGLRVGLTDSNQWHPSVDINKSGFHKIKLENKGQAIDRLRIHELGLVAGDGKAIRVKDIMILEGDWTNKEIPPYFEGMKSVGECEDNKIEILSSNDVWHNKGFTRNCYIQGADGNIVMENNQPQNCVTDFIQVKPNTTYTRNGLNSVCYSHVFFDENKNRVDNINATDYSKPFTFTTPSNCKYLRFKFYLPTTGDVDTIYLIEGTGTEKKSNKKEILMNEPLRGIDNFKDRLVKIGGKWFTERNTEESIFNGDDELYLIHSTNFSDDEYICFYYQIRKAIKNYTNNCVCDKLTCIPDIWNEKKEGIFFQSNIGNVYELVWIKIKKSRLTQSNLNGIKQWLRQNNLKVVYPTTTPIYEPLEIEPTLNTYNDITHISNNSIIPCNMKIKNSGYNAIIKPSTLYTVALDTNKSGTIGMNLGGMKTVTTNNVATITTPAILSDDSLRLFGKGIKGSKVRLLEGDKTNWIPSHFEGMKSSFEDKIQDDGSYKMEILMKNRNLFDCSIILTQNNTLADYSFENNVLTFNQTGQGGMCVPLYVKRGYKYYFNGTTSNVVNIRLYTPNNYGGGGNLFSIGEGVNNTNVSSVYNCNKSGLVMLRFWKADGISTVTNFSVTTEPIEDYVPNMSNKIQFSSIEPLRGVGNIKDKFIFKDGKLMIERNCKQITLDGSENWRLFNSSTVKTKAFYLTKYEFCELVKNNSTHICNIYPKETLGNIWGGEFRGSSVSSVGEFLIRVNNNELETQDVDGFKNILKEVNASVTLILEEPTYEEIPFELQKIILEGYENGTLFLDTNIPPTVTTTYAGETPIVRSVKLNKTEVLNNTNDINDNIIPYLMDMDYRVVCLQLQSENINDGVSMARLFGGAYEMLQRDIQSKRYSTEEYKYRLDTYLSANKITEEEYNKLGDMLNE